MARNSPIPADSPSDAPVAFPLGATGAAIPVLVPPEAPVAFLQPPSGSRGTFEKGAAI